jgi:thioredoxin 1
MHGGTQRTTLATALTAAVVFLATGCGEPPQPPAGASTPTAVGAPDVLALSVGQGRPTVIEFGASACASCRDMKVVLAALRRTHGTQIGIAEIDLIQQREMIPRYRIQVMPTQIFFDAQGREIGRHVGVIDADGILARLGVTAPPG